MSAPVKQPSAASLRQVLATATRPLHVLPSSWWDEEVAVAMCDWIERNVPVGERDAFTYGAES